MGSQCIYHTLQHPPSWVTLFLDLTHGLNKLGNNNIRWWDSSTWPPFGKCWQLKTTKRCHLKTPYFLFSNCQMCFPFWKNQKAIFENNYQIGSWSPTKQDSNTMLNYQFSYKFKFIRFGFTMYLIFSNRGFNVINIYKNYIQLKKEKGGGGVRVEGGYRLKKGTSLSTSSISLIHL